MMVTSNAIWLDEGRLNRSPAQARDDARYYFGGDLLVPGEVAVIPQRLLRRIQARADIHDLPWPTDHLQDGRWDAQVFHYDDQPVIVREHDHLPADRDFKQYPGEAVDLGGVHRLNRIVDYQEAERAVRHRRPSPVRHR